jgi:hypothetical protein
VVRDPCVKPIVLGEQGEAVCGGLDTLMQSAQDVSLVTQLTASRTGLRTTATRAWDLEARNDAGVHFTPLAGANFASLGSRQE